ncbi:MAG: zinc-ribbon domain-containing transport protein, partial [Clostridia bacterium]|nr:zinc-ribbon domain-containing transport protein [Clostridia bacterium]
MPIFGGWSDGGGSSGDDLLLDSEKADAGCTGSGGVLLVLVIVIVIFVWLRYRKSKKAANAASLYQAAEEDAGLPLESLKQKDPGFNEQAFLEKVGNDYVRMQDAWESKDWEPMRAIMTDALYQQMARQLEELKAAGQTNHVERIAVLDARIRRYAQEGDNDVLVVRLSTRICDYTTDDKTGELLRGDRNKELYMTYDWKLIRQKDQRTPEQASLNAVNCPNCGAPLEINHTGKCPYCGSVITLSAHDWALSQIKGIS